MRVLSCASPNTAYIYEVLLINSSLSIIYIQLYGQTIKSVAEVFLQTLLDDNPCAIHQISQNTPQFYLHGIQKRQQYDNLCAPSKLLFRGKIQELRGQIFDLYIAIQTESFNSIKDKAGELVGQNYRGVSDVKLTNDTLKGNYINKEKLKALSDTAIDV